MDINRHDRLRKLINTSGPLSGFINDIFEAAQSSADKNNPEQSCKILDVGSEVLFELKRIEIMSDIQGDIINEIEKSRAERNES